MKTFQQYLKENILKPEPVTIANTLKGAASSVTKEGPAQVLAHLVPYGDLALSALKGAWNRSGGAAILNIKKDRYYNQIKQTIRQNIEQNIRDGKFTNKAATPQKIEFEVDAITDVTDKSQLYLSKEEKEEIIEAVGRASKNNTIEAGFAQKFVNELLQKKINAMKEAIRESTPKQGLGLFTSRSGN